MINRIEQGFYEAYISQITIEELEFAPVFIRDFFTGIENYFVDMLIVTEEVINLANQYIKRGRFSSKTLGDMRQIALVAIYGIDMIVSWNFKHIVNSNRISVYNMINIESGYKPILIYSPTDLIHKYG